MRYGLVERFKSLYRMVRVADALSRISTEALVPRRASSGTNTTERIAAANAVLAALGRRAQLLSRTHEGPLESLVRDPFDMYPFSESREIAGFFDFRLRPGPCSEGNALRLLEKIGYPAAVIEEAMRSVAGCRRPCDADPG